MPHLVHHLGLELPLYGSDRQIVWRKENLKQAFDTEQPTVIRRVSFDFKPIGAVSLRQFLGLADEIFADAAGQCGAQVVEHTWGLSPAALDPHPDPLHEEEHPFLLSGHRLVAEVAVIKSVSAIRHEQYNQLERSLGTYRNEARAKHDMVWGDAHPSQFVNGVGSPDQSRQLWLVDIEPSIWHEHITG